MSQMNYVEEVAHSRFENVRRDGKGIKSGRAITRSRFIRLTNAQDRQYAETFASLVCRGFSPAKARYKSGHYGSRKAVAMIFKDRVWLFAEPAKRTVATVTTENA